MKDTLPFKPDSSLVSLSFRSNPFYEPKTLSPPRPPVGGPSADVGSIQKRRAPPPPSSSPGPGPSPSASKPSSVPDVERAQPVGPSPVAAVMGRELASSSPKVTVKCVVAKLVPVDRFTATTVNSVVHCSVFANAYWIYMYSQSKF